MDVPAYVRASSQYQVALDPSRYQPLHAIDGDPQTLWCTGEKAEAAVGQNLRVALKRLRSITRVAVTAPTDQGARVTGVRVSVGTAAVLLPISDGHADAHLAEALRGDTVDVQVVSTATAAPTSPLDPHVACLAEVTLFEGARTIGGPQVAKLLRRRGQEHHLSGRWAGEPMGAPESELVFQLDGTWEWRFRPLLEGTARHLRGQYRVRGSRLLMRKAGEERWSDAHLDQQRVRVRAGALGAPRADYDVIRIGPKPDLQMAGSYNNAVW